MKKWQRVTLSFGLASSMLVPSFSQAATTSNFSKVGVPKGLPSNEQKLAQNQSQQELQSSDTIIVKYETKLAAKVHQKAGVKIEKSIPSLKYDIVKLTKGQKLSSVLAYYAKQPGVKSATPSVNYQALAVNGDPKNEQMYHLSLLNIDKALSLAGKNAVTVAVIDTGMDTKHPELKSRILPPYSVMNPANQPLADVHGTHVAGIIAAEQNNGIGGHGVNPNAKILPIDVFSGGMSTSDYTIAEGILYAISQKVKVINMSLGGSIESPILEEAVKKAVDAGITIVAAAGNNFGESVSYPAAYEGVIAVSATNYENKLADFSSYGSFVDIAAPGESVYSSVFDSMKGSSFTWLSGTSMASPVVAGVASLILSKYPNLKPNEVEAILKMSAKDLGDSGYDIKYGAGLVDPVKALQFDIKKLPQFSATTDADAKAKAPALTSDSYSWMDEVKLPGETHWYKVKLEQGQGVQALLNGAKQFNYKMLFDFVPDSPEGKAESRQVNGSPNGKQEGGFFQAKEAGTLYVGVKDVYGQYDRKGESYYSLTLKKETEMTIDEVSSDNPVVIENLPFNSSDASKLTFAVDPDAKEGDKDYFRFSVKEPTTVKFDLSAVPGIDSSMSVYFEDEFLAGPPKDLPGDAYYEVPLIAYSNNNGMGEGERVAFDAVPGMNYLIEVSSSPRRDYWYEMMFGAKADTGAVPNSNTPYTLTVEKADFGIDEDGFPMREAQPEEMFEKGEMTEEAYKAKKENDYKAAMEQLAEKNAFRYYPEEFIEMIKAQALPVTLDDQIDGKIQFSGDEDFYKFTATEDAIYKFELARPKEILPVVQIMEYDPEANDFTPIGDIWTSGILYGQEPVLSKSLALKTGKEYYLRFLNDRYQASDESYKLTTEKVMDVPDMDDKDDNRDIRAQVLNPGQMAVNNLVYATDTDYYYYNNRGKSDQYFSLLLNQLPLPEEEVKKLPKDLQDTIVPFINIVEDTNGNLQIDDNEIEKAKMYAPTNYMYGYNIEASFQAKKDVGYFFVINGYTLNGGVSVQPYMLGLGNWNVADEDKGSVLKANVPTKPIKMSSVKGGFEAAGWLNPGIAFGDKDYYSLKVDKYGKYEVKLDAPAGIDGAITILDAKGKKIARLDHYGMGDQEVGTVTLPKGQYYILVEDANGITSLYGYMLSVMKK